LTFYELLERIKAILRLVKTAQSQPDAVRQGKPGCLADLLMNAATREVSVGDNSSS